MVSLEKSVIARLTKNHIRFEILVDPQMALKFRKGIIHEIHDVLAVPEIFKDAKKGERVPESELEECFRTTDTEEIAKEIVKHGEIQLTTEQRRKFVEEKRKEIAYIISQKGVDPKTNLPHPPQRILNAIEEAHANIDPFKPAKEQVQAVLEKIRPIIAIKIETIEIAVRIPMKYAGRASSVLRSIAPVEKEEWKQDSWIAVLKIPAGMQSDIYSKINDLTSGSADIKIIKRT